MRYQIKRIRIVSRVPALLFCIALLLGELNLPSMDWIPGQAYLALRRAVSKGQAHLKKNSAIVEFPGSLEEETKGEFFVDGFSRFSFRNVPTKYLVTKEIFLLIPLFLCSERIILMQERYITRMYLMGYIHDSDGEKGLTQRHLQEILKI